MLLSITVLDIIYRPIFCLKLNSTIGLSVPHKKHITTPLRAQQVNAIYRFVTTVYEHNCHNSGHYPPCCLLFKTKCSLDWIRSPSALNGDIKVVF
jgi:hypothetical protein